MRILIASTFFPPLNSIASLRPYSWAKYWTEHGHDVTVLTTAKQQSPDLDLRFPNPGYKLIEVPLPNFLTRLKGNYQKNNSNAPAQTSLVLKTFNYLRNKKGIFNSCRMPDFTDFWIKPALKAIEHFPKWDLIVSSAGPYTVHILAEKIKKRGQSDKWIADYRDTWSNNYNFPGLFPFNLVEISLEKKLLKSADSITTVSEPLANSLSLKLTSSHVHTIENGFDPSDLYSLDPTPIFPSDGMLRIVHTGSIYLNKRDPSPLFIAISEINQDPVNKHLLDKLEVLFVGSNQLNLRELIHHYKVDNWVKLVGFINRKDALRMQRDAHLLLFLAWNDSSVSGILTGKLFEYIFSKTPIVAVGADTIEASQQLILDSQCGKAFINVEEIKNHLINELKNISKKTTSTSQKLLNRYDRKVLAMKLLDTIL